MGYHAITSNDYEWHERESDSGSRFMADITEPGGLTQSRARLWRYPPGTKGKRHKEMAQEEVFFVLQGTLTMLLGDPGERVEVGPHGVVSVEIGTELQVFNASDEDLVIVIYGAPPVTGQAEILEDATL